MPSLSNRPPLLGGRNATRFKFEATFSKLLAAVRPLSYDIVLTPNIQKLSNLREANDVDFAGRVTIHIEVIRSTNTITLNADGLEITQKNVFLDRVNVKRVMKSDRTVTFVFPQTFGAGPHILEIDYTGTFNSIPQGIYYTDYQTGVGPAARPQRIVVTQFEATDARRMVPCWDEPMFKAKFTLAVELPADFLAISNMPGKFKPGSGSRSSVWTFGTTPKMSSYLLVLVAGELARLADQEISEHIGVDVGVVGPVGREHQGQYALQVLKTLIPYYSDYFGISYPLPKLDLIAIPDFVYTAMENWGGITYIDNVVLFDESNSPHKTRESVFETIAHELAHQWSGNLVTMAWWDDLWLNEGFATWMHKKATDRFNKSWKFRVRAHEDKQSAMALDALNTAREIHHDIVDDSEADGAFDHITYRKGAALIRMIEDYLGEEAFRGGMRIYMRRHQYSNSTTSDLWAALQEASSKDVSTIAAGFVTQPGIPLIRVAQKAAGGKRVVTLSQEPFSIHGSSTDNRRWRVPVRVVRPGGASQIHLVGETPEILEFEGADEPVKVNAGEVGYYRTLYDSATLSQLGARFSRLQAEDQVGLLADTWAMVQAGHYQMQSYLDLVSQIADNVELAVWTDVIATLREIDDLGRDSASRDAFRCYARELLQPLFVKLTWDPLPGEQTAAPLNVMLRSLVIMALGRFGDVDIITESRKRFALGPAKLDKELREAVATVVGYVADEAIFESLQKLGREAPSTETRLMYYYALAGAGSPPLIERMIEIALSNELPTGRVDRFLVSAASTGDNPDGVWGAVFKRREKIFRKLSDLQNQRLLALVAAASSNPLVADQLLAQPAGSPGAAYQVSRAVELIRFKAEFKKKRLLPALEAWLRQRQRD
jgi:aminopeptidase N